MNAVRFIVGWHEHDLRIPSGLEEGAEIYNACRPFPCHRGWRGNFLHGIFYGAIWPEKEYADEYRGRAENLDARRVILVEPAEVEEWGRKFCGEHNIDYTSFEFGDIAASYLQHKRGEEEDAS